MNRDRIFFYIGSVIYTYMRSILSIQTNTNRYFDRFYDPAVISQLCFQILDFLVNQAPEISMQ